MYLINRYLISELIPPFLVGLLLFTGVLILTDLLELTELVVSKGIPLTTVLWGLLLKIPNSFTISAPMSLVMSVILTYGRMTQNNEFLILRSSGFSIFRLSYPSLLLGATLSLTLLTFHQFGLPQLKNYQKKLFQTIQIKNPVNLMHPKTYFEYESYTIYASDIKGNQLNDVYIEDRSYSEPQIIYSKSGKWIRLKNAQYILRLREGTLHQPTKDGGYRVVNFQSQTIQFDDSNSSTSRQIENPAPTLYEKYKKYVDNYQKHRTILKRIEEHSEGSVDNTLKKQINKIKNQYLQSATNFHRPIALSFASLFLVFATVPLALVTKQGGNTLALSFSLGVITFYYIILSLAEPLAINGWVPPAPALWSGNIISAIAGTLIMYKVRSL